MSDVLDTVGYGLTPAYARRMMAQTPRRHGYRVSATGRAACYAGGSTAGEHEGATGTATTGFATADATARISRCTCTSDRLTS